MPLRGRVGRHSRQGGRQCQNWPGDQQTVIALLNRIPVSEGGAGGSITGPVVSGIASDALYRAISRFEDKYFSGQKHGFLDPGGPMLKRMEALAVRSSATAAPSPPAIPVASKKKTEFHPGVMHDHQPTGRWADVQSDPKSAFGINFTCKHFSPVDVISAASASTMGGKPLARDHLAWFLTKGGGRDFVEDENLKIMLRTDAKVQEKIRKAIPSGRSSGTFSAYVTIEQDDYSDEDFKFAFGAIDRLDFEVDFTAGTLHAWFMDRYEWHPVYPGIYENKNGDYERDTNCVHAAAVELKTGTARDFWMKGETTISFRDIQSAADRKKDPWDDPPAAVY